MIAIIAAYAQNRVIGRAGRIPWKIPGEQLRFRELTLGNVVIMGRRTYEEIGRRDTFRGIDRQGTSAHPDTYDGDTCLRLVIDYALDSETLAQFGYGVLERYTVIIRSSDHNGLHTRPLCGT